jgi:hypothetical protein
MPRRETGPRWLGALFVCSLIFATSDARADWFTALRSAAMREVHHRIVLTMAPGQATMVVRRGVYNGGPRPDEATFGIDLPDGAVAVGLRTLGELAGKPHWFAGELMEAEAAAAKYLELTGIGVAYPKDPALLSWRFMGHLRLQVFPCMPATIKEIEYTLAMPTSYRDGAHHLTVGQMGTEEVQAEITVEAAQVQGAQLFVDGTPVPPGSRLTLGDAPVDVALTLPQFAPLAGALASLAVDETTSLARYRIEAAPKLGTAPIGARVVLVLDTSRSLREDDLAAAVTAARAYLSFMPAAEVEVVTFDRTPRRLFGTFVSTAEASARLAAATLQRKNGSQIDDALVLASELADDGRGPKRIVVFTDTHTRAELAPDRLRAIASPEALLHVVAIRATREFLLRDDDHDWNAFTRPTGGLVWYGGARPGGTGAAFEELARPLRLHRVAVSTDVAAVDVEPELVEGASLAGLESGTLAPRWLALQAERWAEPVRFRLEADPVESKRWAALIFGDVAHYELSDAQMMVLAQRGGAVSPVTSYLAIEPGVRPSREGIEHGAGYGQSGAGIGFSCRAAMAAKPPFDAEGFLADRLGAAWSACGGSGAHAKVELQTTRAEIVMVDGVESTGAQEAARCLEEFVWALPLPAEFEADHARFSLSL